MNSNDALTEHEAWLVLKAACRHGGLASDGAELVRIGSNAVYRLREQPVIVRISRDGALEDVRRQVNVARWLVGEGYPATRALDLEQPIVVRGRAVTFWESASERTDYASLEQVGRLLRWLHRLTSPKDLALPEKCPFDDDIGDRLAYLEGLPAADAGYLRERLADVQLRYAALDFVLTPGVIHGDANIGNVILDRAGEPVLIDLDGFCTGPREWDLVQTALFYERFGWHTAGEYRQFVDAYGFDIMDWPGYPVLADYREIAMTLWLCGKAQWDQEAAAEVTKRVSSMRDGGDRRDWEPF
ncbi:aminoglycoside phosphotransferase family protein [Streptomonospora nanhaiensis]|nr:aminoglycoside phosphotransferase family protein [Streptomonospora nanhaiensis]